MSTVARSAITWGISNPSPATEDRCVHTGSAHAAPCHPVFCRALIEGLETSEPENTRNHYDNLIVNEGSAGTQDLESGVFTAAATGERGGRSHSPGLYIVSFDMYVYTTDGRFLTLHLYK